ncbi:hypothetical protein CAter10_2813 [Collimonas arenae]|nr:hypothetical protein CAter10_2813 [Collimonas arenae]
MVPDVDPSDFPKLPPPLAQPASKAVNSTDTATTPLLRDAFMMYSPLVKFRTTRSCSAISQRTCQSKNRGSRGLKVSGISIKKRK